MSGKGGPKKGAAGAKGKAAGKVAASTAELDLFNKVYYEKGKVCTFPDILVPKPKLYKTGTTRKDPLPAGGQTDLQASRRQGSASQDAESHADKTTGDVSQSQQQAQEQGERSAETHEASSVHAANSRVNSLQQENLKDMPGGEGGQKRGKRGEKIEIKEPKSYVLDEEKLIDKNVQAQLRAEECGFLVLKEMEAALGEIARPVDPPVFLIHNQNLRVIVEGKQRTKIELDLLILHPTLGVLLVEVKAVKSVTSFSRFDVATEQLLRAKEFVLEKMGDLLEEDAVVLTMALPELQPEDFSVIRQRAQELSSSKQGLQDAAATQASADKTGGSGGAGQGNVPKFKGTALLGDHPEIYLLCGLAAEVFREWVGWLRQQRLKSGHAFKGANEAERLYNFKRACIRCLGVPGLRPGQSVRDSADLNHRFLLTEEQLRVRDCQNELLHISGPHGSGKTLLLEERARRWLREGRHVVLAVGSPKLDLLLRHLMQSVCGKNKNVTMITAHKGFVDLMRFLDNVPTDDPVSLIVDEVSPVEKNVLGLLGHVTAGRVRDLWSADTRQFPATLKARLQRLGGSTVELRLCLRCPHHIMDWTNNVKLEEDPPLLPPPVPITQELVRVKVISHSDHDHFQSWDVCPRCEEEGKVLFTSLGFVGGNAKPPLKLSDVVVLTTASCCDRDRVAEWLRHLGVYAVAEKKCNRDTPVLPPGVTPDSRHQVETEVQSRILKGTDNKGRPAIHVVGCEDFKGVEKPVVLLWHEDKNDEDQYDTEIKDLQYYRLLEHRYSWSVAATRCQGRLAVMAVTPSPLLPLLQSTSTSMGILKKKSLAFPISQK